MSAAARAPAGFGRSGFSLGVRFVLLAIVCVALMLLDQRQQQVQRVRQALSVVVYPVRVLVDLPFRAWQSASVNMTEGDIMIQRGTMHGWANPGDKPCRFATVIIDGGGRFFEG